MYRSLRRHSPGCRLFALCFDEAAYDRVTSLKPEGMVPLRLADLEASFPELPAVNPTRSGHEYYLTCTPFLPLYLLARFRDIELITYLDSDLYFFGSPEPAFEEMGAASIAITPHRFAPNVVGGEKTGKFNDGWMTFRRGPEAAACLNWWKERCLEWCYDRSEDGKHAEQGYLNSWPALFSGVAVLENPGVNCGPWNLRNADITLSGGALAVRGRPLVFYHFSGLWQVNSWLYDTSLLDYKIRPSALVRERLYRPYMMELFSALSSLGDLAAAFPAARSAVGFHKPGFTLKRFLKSACGRQLIYTFSGKVLS